MSSESLVRALRSLKLHGMAQAVDELARQNAPAFSNIEPMLNTLIKAEVAEREVRSINYQMRAARFPAYRDLSGFNFSEAAADEGLLHSLHQCDFIADAHNVVMIGGPGTGKTHLATAIGVQAITHHRLRARFFSTIELVNTLEQEKANGRPGQIANRLVQVDLVILDELGYLPFSQAGSALLFHLLSKAEIAIAATGGNVAREAAEAVNGRPVVPPPAKDGKPQPTFGDLWRDPARRPEVKRHLAQALAQGRERGAERGIGR